MIRRRAAALLGIVCLLCGCTHQDAQMLSAYNPDSVFTSSGLQTLTRADRVSGGICVVADESLYDSSYLNAAAGGLFNLTETQTVYAKNANDTLAVASLTKLMTAYLCLKYGDLDTLVTVGDEVVITDYDAWLCGFEPGDTLTLRDLLNCTMVYSGNDAAAAVATAIAGDNASFVKMMNDEAALIGTLHTKFGNATGLDSGNGRSTVYDIYLIFNACLAFPEFRQIIEQSRITVNYTGADGTEKSRSFTSGNSYFTDTASPPKNIVVCGGKTGHTEKAGYCLAMLSVNDVGDEFISVILGTDVKQQVYAQTNLLLELVN